MTVRRISRSDLETLARFRYQLRRFLRFSEEATRRAGVTPLPGRKRLDLLARLHRDELQSVQAGFSIPGLTASGGMAPGVEHARTRAARPSGAEPADGAPTEVSCKVLTVGHSTRPIDKFLELLTAHHVTQLVDVRTVPRSRHNPQYNTDTLPEHLAGAGIGYQHRPGLGGFRRTTPDSLNTGWRNLSFRGYADYMQSDDFAAHLAWLIELARRERVALMCAEAVPWRCHRSLIADALLVHGIATCEIASPARLQAHKLTRFARVDGTGIHYPPVVD